MNLTEACAALGVSRSGYHALLLKRPAPQRPDQVWATDITYLPTR